MSGVVAPAYPITEPFGTAAANPADITLPIPVPSQVAILTGAASFADGFPTSTRTDPELGGVPPFQQDFNGIFYMLSQYAALAQAGQHAPFNAAAAAAFGGYQAGAVVRSTVTPTKFFFNLTDGNTNNPDSVTTGWMVFSPLGNPTGLQATTLATGTTNDLALAIGTGFLDLNPYTGPVDLTGIDAANVADGQLLTITNLNASNAVTLKMFSVGSGATARFRMPSDITLLQYSGVTLRYSVGVGMWTLT